MEAKHIFVAIAVVGVVFLLGASAFFVFSEYPVQPDTSFNRDDETETTEMDQVELPDNITQKETLTESDVDIVNQMIESGQEVREIEDNKFLVGDSQVLIVEGNNYKFQTIKEGPQNE
jgi:hypothetical protein